MCEYCLHAVRTGRTCPSEVRHARWKIPLKHLQSNSTVSPSFFQTIFDLSNPRLPLFLIHLPVPATTFMLTRALFNEIGFRGCFIHRGIYTSMAVFSPFFFFALLANATVRAENGRERRQGGGGRRVGLYLHHLGLVLLWLGAALLESPHCISVCCLHMRLQHIKHKFCNLVI